MMMYVLMFFAALVICYKYADLPKKSIIPFGKAGYWIICLLGVVGCVITIVVGFFPPSAIDVGGPVHYEVLFVSGIILMLLPILLFYGYKRYGRLFFYSMSNFPLKKNKCVIHCVPGLINNLCRLLLMRLIKQFFPNKLLLS